HLPRRVAAPPRAWRDILSLHEEGIGGEGRAITHGYAIEDECSDPERAASANRGSVAFERAVLQRMTLDLAPVVEDRLVPDRGERDGEHEEHGADNMRQYVVQLDGGEVEQRE